MKLEGRKAISNEEAQAIKGAMKELNWEMQVLTPKQLAIEDSKEVLCDKTKDKLKQAVTAMNITARDVEKTLPACVALTSESAKRVGKDLKDKLKQLYHWIQLINEQNMGLADPWKNSAEVKKDLEKAALCVIDTQDSLKSVKAVLNSK
jgi:hypothetical protein